VRSVYPATVPDQARDADLARNRDLWSLLNEQFTDSAADRAWSDDEVRWGLFGTPDRTLGVLDDVAGLDVVELACGTAYFSAWLRRRGARVVALDLSPDQLRTARRCQRTYGPPFPVVQADAQRVPLAAGRFDLVLSEHGVAAWCDPELWVPEAARLLRPGGRVVFLTNSLLSAMCVPADSGPAGDRLLRGQRETSRIVWPGGGVERHPSHGDWIAVLRRSGFVVEALRELYAPPGSTDHEYYDIVTADWASRWPAEELWVARLSP
jgi:SAM-dependent methyltransferase